MKTIQLLLTVCFVGFICVSQNTYVPDDKFEQALIDLGYDTAPLDNYVPTANIAIVTELNISSLGITNLTGIEDFISLTELKCAHNLYTSLDFSSNTALTYLSCGGSYLTSLNVSQNTALTYLQCFGAWDPTSGISNLDLSNNAALITLDCQAFYKLTSLDVSQNTLLKSLRCSYNQITSLDLSQHTVLEYLACENNNLTSLNVKNGNNINFTYFNTTFNFNLTCIDVDDRAWSITNWTAIDNQTTFSVNCEALSTDTLEVPIFNLYPNPARNTLTIHSKEIANYLLINFNGKIVKNGELVKEQDTIDLANISPGLYFLKVSTDRGIVTKKIVIL